MKNLIILMLAAGIGSYSTAVYAQQTHLQCDGKFSNWDLRPPVIDAPVTGLSLKIDLNDNAVDLVSGLSGLDGRHPIITNNDTGIGFRVDAYTGGFINRLTGELSLSSKRNESNLRWMLSGNCAPARRMF